VTVKHTGSDEAAFPRPYSQYEGRKGTEPLDEQAGMTMREWYAGQAMVMIGAMLAAAATPESLFRLLADPGAGVSNGLTVAVIAFRHADAMLEAAARGGKGE
jgi:hypothetical protein